MGLILLLLLSQRLPGLNRDAAKLETEFQAQGIGLATGSADFPRELHLWKLLQDLGLLVSDMIKMPAQVNGGMDMGITFWDHLTLSA